VITYIRLAVNRACCSHYVASLTAIHAPIPSKRPLMLQFPARIDSEFEINLCSVLTPSAVAETTKEAAYVPVTPGTAWL